MKKVKVQRYISGKRPEYAQYNSSDEESAEEDFIDRKAQRNFANRGDEITMDLGRDRHDNDYDGHEAADAGDDEEAMADPRLRRLMHARHSGRDDGERIQRHRHIHEPAIEESDEDDDEEDERNELGDDVQPIDMDLEQPGYDEARNRRIALASDSESDPELSDAEIENRRQRLRNKMLQQRKDEEVLLKEEEKQSESSESSSEYEEETESEAENEPRLKPLFVRKRDRATIAEKEKEAAKQRQLEYEAKKAAKDRRRHTLRIVEDSIKKDLEKTKVRVD